MGKYTVRNKQLSCLVALFLLVLLAAGCQSREQRAERFLGRGKRYIEQQKFAEAAIELQNALQLAPGNVESRFYLGLCFLQQRNFRSAYRQIKSVLDLQPSHLGARLAMAELEFQTGDTASARADLRMVQAADPTNLNAQILSAKTYLLDKDYARSRTEWEKAKQLAPREAVIWSAAGFTNVLSKRYADAENDFRRALALDPANPECFRNLVNLLILTGRADQAEILLREATARLPKSLELQLVLADLLYRQGRAADLEQLLSQLQSRARDLPDLSMELGDFWLARDQVQRAVTEYERERAQHAGPIIDKKLISAYVSLRQVADAERLNAPLLKQNPRDPEARAFAGAIAFLKGDYDAANRAFQDVLTEDPASVFANYYQGLSWMAVNRPELAKSALFQCVRVDASFIYPYLRLAEMALARKDWAGAEQYAVKALELNPRMADGYLLLAQAQLGRDAVAKAEATLRACGHLAAEGPEYYELQARLKASKGDRSSAEEYLGKAMASSGNPFAVLSRYVQFEVSRGQITSATARVKAWIRDRSEQVEAYELLAQLYLEQRDLGAAEAACRQALRLRPARSMPHFLLAQVHERSNQPAEALVEYDESIRLNSRATASYIAAGNVAAHIGQYDRAKTYYEAALRAEPDSPGAKYGLVRDYADRGDNLQVALTMAQDLKKRFPDDHYISDALGWVYYRSRLYSLALEQLEPAAQALPQDATVQYHLGMTYLQSGKPEDARRALRRALKLGLLPPALAEEAQRTLGRAQS